MHTETRMLSSYGIILPRPTETIQKAIRSTELAEAQLTSQREKFI
jgi:hypothetical protein